MCFSFPDGTFFPSSAKTRYLLAITQNFDKSVTGVVKKPVKNVFLSKGRLNFWVKCSEPKNQITKKFSELQQLEVGFRVQPNIPIVILILLTGFYRFLKWAKHQWDICGSSIFKAVKDDNIHDGKHFFRKIIKQGGRCWYLLETSRFLTIFGPTQKWRVQRNTNSSTKKDHL